MTITTYGGKQISIPGAVGTVDANGTLSVHLHDVLIGQICSSEWSWWFALPEEGIGDLGTPQVGT